VLAGQRHKIRTGGDVIEVQDLTKYFALRKGIVFAKQVGAVKAVDGVSFVVEEGQTFGLVGESGCGKTTVCKLILLLEQITTGSILFDGQDVQGLRGQDLQRYKKSVQAVFQDPYSSLSPRMKIGEFLSEPMRVHNTMPKAEMKDRVAELLQNVGLNPESAGLYPHEFSGGQRQRIAVARSLASTPRLIVLDEPVSALDVSIRAQILNLLADLQQRFGLTYLMVAHDLAVVEHVSDVIAVMYLGKIVEMAPSGELSQNPLHPYTRALLAAVPRPDPDIPLGDDILSGEVPSPVNPPFGCRFHPRCAQAKSACAEAEPPLREVGGGHLVACGAG
jgi:oligopeptide transport system ATP-binding protein